MRLSGTNELVAIGIVILVTCFSPSLVSPLVRSHVGKAIALAGTAYVSLHVSQPLALFLAVLVLSCCSKESMGMNEYMCKTSMSTKETCEATANGGTWDDSTKKCKCGGM
jgi:hypothetical protein